jgi:hypothetical protein
VAAIVAMPAPKALSQIVTIKVIMLVSPVGLSLCLCCTAVVHGCITTIVHHMCQTHFLPFVHFSADLRFGAKKGMERP